MPIPDLSLLLEHDRSAVLCTVGLVERIAPDDLARPTPCAGWTLRQLLAHLTGQQLGFAAAAGQGGDLARWLPVEPADPIAGYRQACSEVLTAFAEPGVAELGLHLPEIRDGRAFPAVQAISFHLVDNAVHAWDLAATLGLELQLDPAVLRSAVAVARQVPDGPERLVAGAAFRPSHPVAADGGDLDTMLRLLGRSSSDWTG